jgi:hypothetical protein
MNDLLPDIIKRYQMLRVLPDKSPEDLQVEEYDEQETEEEKAIVCAQCRHSITSTAQRIEINGMHQHTFFNPYGIIYEIGCFQSAQGCGHVGPTTDEFSWFPGYGWRIAVCSSCLTHLGWLYSAPDKESFHGLILDHLLQPDE